MYLDASGKCMIGRIYLQHDADDDTLSANAVLELTLAVAEQGLR
jgi:hypothetical protein